MKHRVLEIYNSLTSNKYEYNFKKYPDIYNWIVDNTQFLSPDVKFLERLYCVLNDIQPSCSKQKFTQNLNKGYAFCGTATTCLCAKTNHSSKISAAKQAMSIDNILLANEKRKVTCIKKYGTEFNSQSDVVKQKKVDTCRSKFGEDTNLVTTDTKAKIKETLLQRYGVTNPSKHPSTLQKRAITNLERYGNSCSAQSSIIRDKIYSKHLSEYGVKLFPKAKYSENQIKLLTNRDHLESEYNTLGIAGICTSYQLHRDRVVFRLDAWGIEYNKNITGIEEFVKTILDEHNVKYEYRSRKIIKPLELDFYLPDYNIAIEVNGLYWHSEQFVNKQYHTSKLKQCSEQGIQLITIFSDEIEQKPDIVKSRLLHILKKSVNVTVARKCSIQHIGNEQSADFLSTYHIQGVGKSTIKLGAFYNNDLVAVMTFSTNRKFTGNKEQYYELVRFATVGNIPGIAGKLFSAFIREYSPEKVISYADRRWSNGNLYTALRFKLVRTSEQNYWYSKNMLLREHRFKFTKQKLVSLGFDQSKSESEIMQTRGYKKIWDCGTLCFEYR